MRTAITTAAAVLLSATVVAAQDRFELEASFWEPDLAGGVRVLEQGVGQELDFGADLSLAAEGVTDVRVALRPSRRTEIRFARLPLSAAGDAVATRTLEFGGEVFTLSTRIVSRLELDYLRAGFAWQFLSSADGRFRAGPLLEVKGFTGDASLAAPELLLPVSVAEDFDAAFGSAGLAVDLEPSDRVHLFGELTVVVGADEGSQTDLEAGVRVKLTGPLAARVGYRSIRIDLADGDDRVDFDVEGAFFGVSLAF